MFEKTVQKIVIFLSLPMCTVGRVRVKCEDDGDDGVVVNLNFILGKEQRTVFAFYLPKLCLKSAFF
jgi:hypothetical protein